MATSSPQLGIVSTIALNQSDLTTLHSVGKLVLPAQSGYINVFVRATLIYIYKNTVLSNVNNSLYFYYAPGGPTVLCSNSLNALNYLGLAQNTNPSFDPANPYTASMAAMVNVPIYFGIAGSDPTGGDPGTTASLTITSNLHAA